MELGQEYTDKVALPPGLHQWNLDGYCTPECTSAVRPRFSLACIEHCAAMQNAISPDSLVVITNKLCRGIGGNNVDGYITRKTRLDIIEKYDY